MKRADGHPLSPALLELLQACADTGGTDTKTLAKVLGRAPTTVNTEFQRISEALGTHSRTRALMLAIKKGWVTADLEQTIVIDPDSDS